MTILRPLFESWGLCPPSEEDARFLAELTVFPPTGFDVMAAAAVSNRTATESELSLARLASLHLVGTVPGASKVRLWTLVGDLRERLRASAAPDLLARAHLAHGEYFLRDFRAFGFIECDPTRIEDRTYLEFKRVNLELAALRRIGQVVGTPVASEPLADLTRRQREVAKLVAAGLTNYQISQRLGIAEWTAVNHVRSAMRRLGCESRVDVARVVILSGSFGVAMAEPLGVPRATD